MTASARARRLSTRRAARERISRDANSASTRRCRDALATDGRRLRRNHGLLCARSSRSHHHVRRGAAGAAAAAAAAAGPRARAASSVPPNFMRPNGWRARPQARPRYPRRRRRGGAAAKLRPAGRCVDARCHAAGDRRQRRQRRADGELPEAPVRALLLQRALGAVFGGGAHRAGAPRGSAGAARALLGTSGLSSTPASRWMRRALRVRAGAAAAAVGARDVRRPGVGRVGPPAPWSAHVADADRREAARGDPRFVDA